MSLYLKTLTYLIILFNFLACSSNYNEHEITLQQPGFWLKEVHCDKAIYSPKSNVEFTLSFEQPPEKNSKILVRYLHLDTVIESQIIETTSDLFLKWYWTPPKEDYKGYLVEMFITIEDNYLDQINIAVDVSSNWKKFPRYGFVSKFDNVNQNSIDSVMKKLNRHHINGIQFYDWHYKHHMPLSIREDQVTDTWMDIAKRTIYRKTIEKYIAATKRYGMQSMAYNLLYGSWEDGPIDGVSKAWRLYSDSTLQNAVKIDFDDNWSSDIYWMNPANKNWQDYIFNQTEKVFNNLSFDGWHIDQLGDWGKMWTDKKLEVSPDTTFGQFLENASKYLNKPIVMNAVLQYGQAQIAKSPVEFLYSEVWDPDSTFAALQSIINENNKLSSNKLKTVLTAYVNQGIAEKPGLANNAAILLTDALIFALGGSHLELGEHLLIHPYFPNNNLKMDADLELNVLNYYDYLVAYQNLLRGDLNVVHLNLLSSEVEFSDTPEKNKVFYLAKKDKDRCVINLVNFDSVKTMNWRDNYSEQNEPKTINNLVLEFDISNDLSSVWCASPDFKSISPIPLKFSKNGSVVKVTIPKLKYWTTLVLEIR